MKIQLRPECTCMEFVPCSSFRNILKVFESVMRMRIFFYRANHRRFFTHLQQRQIVIANIMSHNAQSTLT